MPVPWLQIVQLVPSILDVSRELLRKTRTLPTPPAEPGSDNDTLASHVARLEENERRQAELINQMAEQIASLSRAVTVLHQRVIWLTAGLSVAIVAAAVAIARLA
ncbi:MAG TPA: hypothetical protein VNQ81_11555 [Povalibacter sp.]|nr:hypothetical protein [Povalibacter sp.]